MKKKSIAIMLILIFIGILFSSCVTQPRFSDYIGSTKDDALRDLDKHKSSNTVRVVLNWLLWGWIGLYIPSIVDTVNYFNYLDDFRDIERKIEATPNNGKVGQQ